MSTSATALKWANPPREEAFTLPLLTCLLLGSVELQDLLTRSAYGWKGDDHPIHASATIFPLLLFGAGWFRAALSGLWFCVSALLVSVSAWIVVTNFRGLWIRPGTLDLFNISPRPWLLPFILSASFALVAGLLVRKFTGKAPGTRLGTAITATVLYLGLGTTTGLLAMNMKDYTVFQATRIWVTLLVVVFNVVSIAYGRREQRNEV